MGRSKAVRRDPRRGFGEETDYDIRVRDDNSVLMFTWYKGHAFEGWRSNAMFRTAEEDGVIGWDAAGEPVIDPSRVRITSPPPEYVI